MMLAALDGHNRYWAEKLDNPAHYDRLVKLLVEYNPLYKDQWPVNPEKGAAETIDFCINRALDVGDCSTGCCAAWRTPSGKVRIFLDPLRPID